GLGSPIRTPTDHSLVDNSPWTIAASHVLHRRLVPRHPPYATFTWPLQITRCSRTLFTNQKTHQTPTTTHQPNHQHTRQQARPVRVHQGWHTGTNHTGCPLRHPTAHPPTPTQDAGGNDAQPSPNHPRARSATQANHPGSTDEPDQQKNAGLSKTP